MFDNSFDELLKNNSNNLELHHKLLSENNNLSLADKDSTSPTLDLNKIHAVTDIFSEKETKASFENLLTRYSEINQKYSNLPVEHRNDVMRIAKDLPQLVKGFLSPVAFLEAKTTKELKNSMTNFLDVNQA